jgi:hypothetical protein
MDWIISIIGGLVGAIIAISFTILIEHFRKPKLNIKIGNTENVNWSGRPANRARWLRLRVENKELPWWARWLSRNMALHCSGLITFYHLDGQNVFGRSMQARWWGVREPLPIQIMAQGHPTMYILDPERLAPEKHRDIYAGESEQLDLAVRFDDDEECYGWCNDNYNSNPKWRNPDWKLGHERYLVEVTVVSSGGERCISLFRLVSDVPIDGFRLENPQAGDYGKILRR